MTETIYPNWYAWSQFLVCSIAGIVLISVYRRGFIDSKDPNARYLQYDRCFVYLSVGTFMWAAVGALLLLGEARDNTAIGTIRTMLSIVNSTALIFAAAHLDYGHPLIRKLQQDSIWHEIPRLGLVALILFVVGVLSTYALEGDAEAIPDFAISVLTLGVLTLGLWESFRSRGFGFLAFMSLVVLGFQVFAQIPEISSSFAGRLGENRWIIVLNSKVMAIYLFLALAYSWMHQRHRIAQGSELNVEVQLLAPHGKRNFPVRISSRFGATEFNLGRITYLRLLELCVARLLDDPDEGFIETDLMFDSPTNIDNHVRHIRRTVENHLGEVYRDLEFDLIETSRELQSKRINIAPAHIAVDIAGILAWRGEQDMQEGDPWKSPLLAVWIARRFRQMPEDESGWNIIADLLEEGNQKS